MSDTFIGPMWVLINVLLTVTTWKWSRHLFPKDRLFEILAHTVVLSWGCIVAVATLLGIVYCLTGLSVLVGVGAASAIALVILKRTPNDGLHNLLAVSASEKAWLCLWCVQVGFWIAHVMTNGLWRFPSDFDTLNYHLPLVDHWLQTGTLYAPDCWMWTAPGNNELLAVWATGPFSGDFLGSLNNFPSVILFACSSVMLGSRIGLPPALAHLGSFALTANYVVLKQLIDNENDVAAAACFFAAVLYVFRFVQTGERRDLYMAGISVGLLCGIKFYASGYAVLVLGTLVVVAAVAKGRRVAWEALLIGSVGMFLWGGYWYVRNVLVTGSPFYPKEFFTSSDTLTQMYPEVGSTSFFGNGRPELLSLYIESVWQMAGPCQLCGFLAVPLSLIWLVSTATWAWSRRQVMYFVSPRLTLALLVAGTGLLLGLTPFAVEDDYGTLNQMHLHYCPVRYGMCFLSLATMACMLMLHDICVIVQRWHPTWASPQKSLTKGYYTQGCVWLIGVVLAGTSLHQIIYVHPGLQIDHWICFNFGIALVLVFTVGFIILAMWPRIWTPLAVLLLVGTVPASMWASGRLSQHWHHGFEPHFEGLLNAPDLSFLPSNLGESMIVCVLDDRCYPYFGSRRQNRVCQPSFAPSSAWLMNYFHQVNVDIIIQRHELRQLAGKHFLGVGECFKKHPNRFRALFNNELLTIHRFFRSAP